jgi:type IV pilus assembly protein PilC
MPNFRYEAWSAESQPVTGELEAATVQEAISQLESRGLTLQSIGYTPSAVPLEAVERSATDVSSARLVEEQVLRAHLAKVLEGGKQIIPALQALSEETLAGRRRNELQCLIHILERGDAAEAERAFAGLPEYWIPLLSAAISSNDPGRILQDFLRESQRADEFRRQWWLTLAYPILVACIAGAVLIFISVLVIPIYRDIFIEFNLTLPTLTIINLTVALWIARTWPYILIAFALVVGSLLFISIRGPFRRSIFAHRFPALFGSATAIARLSRFMADLLESGLTIPDTLKIAGLLTNRRRLRTAIWRLADQLQTNQHAAQQIGAPSRMATVFHALRSEMPPESRVRLLREIGEVHAERARLRLSWTRGVIEPITILAVGCVVGIVVVSLFLPLVKLIHGLSS